MIDTTDTAPRYRIAIAAAGKHGIAAERAIEGVYQCGAPVAAMMRRLGRVGDSRAAWAYPLDVATNTAASMNAAFASLGGVGQPFRTSEAP